MGNLKSKNELYDVLVCGADQVISEALASILYAININPILLSDYSEVKIKITDNTRALLIDENVVYNGKKIHIRKIQSNLNIDMPILCLTENISDANNYNSFMHFYQKPLDKNTLNNALIPHLKDATSKTLGTIIKMGKFSFDENLNTLLDAKNNLINLTNLEARLLFLFFKNLNDSLTEDFLLEQVWGYSSNTSSNTVKTHIWKLRKKIYNNDDNIFILETTTKGYVLKQK